MTSWKLSSRRDSRVETYILFWHINLQLAKKTIAVNFIYQEWSLLWAWNFTCQCATTSSTCVFYFPRNFQNSFHEIYKEERRYLDISFSVASNPLNFLPPIIGFFIWSQINCFFWLSADSIQGERAVLSSACLLYPLSLSASYKKLYAIMYPGDQDYVLGLFG